MRCDMKAQHDKNLSEKAVNQPKQSQVYPDAGFFSHPRHPGKIHTWVHTNFSEDGYAYFISLGIGPKDAIHLASTNVNAVFFRKEAEKASASYTTEPEIKDAQLNCLRKLIKELTQRGGWTDDLQNCIQSIAKAINSEQAWGDHGRKEIGVGERLVYTTAVEHAETLKKIEEERLASENSDKENQKPLDFHNNYYEGGEIPPDSSTCIII